MKSLEVRFIRHGHGSHMLKPGLIVGRCVEVALTPEGELQAAAKGRELAARGVLPDRVVSSSAVRCVQTAKQMIKAMGIDTKIELTDELLEMDQGEYVGRSRKEIAGDPLRQQQILEHGGRNFVVPGGESMSQTGERGVNWLRSQELLATVAGSSIIAAAHLGIITHTIASIEGWDYERTLAMQRTVAPVSETHVVFEEGLWHVEAFAKPIQNI